MLLSLGLLLILLGLSIKFFWPRYTKYKRIWTLVDRIPGPKTKFLFGNLLDLQGKNNVEQFQKSLGVAIKYQNEGYGLHRHWITVFVPTIMVYRADHIENLVTNSTNLNKSFGYTFLHSWLGTGLLTSHGDKWHYRRKLLTPAFHFKILEDYAPLFDKHSRRLVAKLRPLAEQGSDFDISKIYGLSTLDMICETAMGKQIEAINDENSSYVRAIKIVSEMLNKRFFNPWMWPEFIFGLSSMGRRWKENVQLLHKFTNQIIQDRKRESVETEDRSKSKRRSRSFLDQLLKTRALSDDDIREEVDTFMFEGHDTTAMGLNWATYLLGLHPEIQEKVVDEADRVMGKTDRPITLDDVKDLKYLDRVIKECQRLYPSVPQFSRLLTSDVKLGGDYIAPAGSSIVVMTHQLHRDPIAFPDPEKFDPDRFLPENSVGRSPFAYLPFSAGLRNCIGQKFAMAEMKICLVNVLRNFVVTSLHERDRMELLRELVLRPNDGIWIRLQPRTTQTE